MNYGHYEKPKYIRTFDSDDTNLLYAIECVEKEINRCRFIIANWEADLKFCTNAKLINPPYGSNKYFNEVLDRINHYNRQIERLEEFLQTPDLGNVPDVDDNEEVIWMDVM